MADSAAKPDASRAKEPAIAVRLALLLDGRRTGLTFDEIVASGALSVDDRSESGDTLRKRFDRARERLGRVGIVVANVAPDSADARYVVNADLSYSAKQNVSLTKKQAMQLASLFAVCQQVDLPFRDDFDRARMRLASIVRVNDGADHQQARANAIAVSHASKPAPTNTARVSEGHGGTPSSSEITSNAVLNIVTDAYTQAQPLTFSYANAQGVPSRRTVDVYGLFAHRAHTYLVGLDETLGQVRVFRIDRIAEKPSPQTDRTRTYTPPVDFDIRDYRHLPFQYGDNPFVATFRDTRGLSDQQRAAATQGFGTWEGSGQGALWHVDARDLDEAAAWAVLALSQDGLLPVGPSELVTAARAGLERTVRMHG